MKVLKLLGKIIGGIFLFYLVLGFIIIPLALCWAIPSQGSKFLKTPVKVSSVWFNPVLLRFSMDGFEILDHQNQEMVGFDKLIVHVKALDLLKKVYHVELFEIDGLKINVELLSGNQINLMGLVPPGVIPPPQSKAAPKAPVVQKSTITPATPVSLPKVIIDSIILHNGQVHFTDTTIKPVFSTMAAPMELSITNVTTDPNTEAKIKFNSDMDVKGKISMETVIIPLSQPLQMETTLSLNDYALRILTPYIGKYTGRELRSGKLDLTIDYRIGGNKLTANHKLLIQNFQFGQSVQSKDALHLPFGLAVALLEDPDGKMSISLPVTGDMNDPKFKYTHLVLQVTRNFFFNLVTKPFSFLASGLGVSGGSVDELGYVRFKPGLSDLSNKQKTKMLTLIKGLKEHPLLTLEINGAYDPEADWRAIEADTFSKDYTQLKKVSGDWSDSKLYQLLYQRHFGLLGLWSLAKKYKKGMGQYDDAALDKEIKRQLIENSPPDNAALEGLAQTRARIVQGFLLNNGFDAKHLSLGHAQPTQSSMGYIPLSFTLTVFGKN